ncbi:MAG: tetratricopeptide repeat protein, partial [Bryobacteraceae bacterium]
KYPGSRNNLGIELLRRGERAEALMQFTASLTADPKNVTALYNLGRIELDSGDHQRALLHLTAASALVPSDLPIRIALAGALALSGKELLAREKLRDPLEKRPSLAEELLSLGRVASSQGRHANARAILAAFDPSPAQAAEWHAISGYADYKLGNPQRAQERLRRAIELNPMAEEYWMDMAELLLFHQSFDAAIAFLTTGLGKLPESARLHLGLGVSQLAAGGQNEDAIRHLETSLQIQPNFEPALSALCEAHHRNKEWKQLDLTAARWLRANPQAYGSFYYRAIALIEGDSKEHAESLAEARRLLRQSIQMQPRFAASRIAMGKLLNQLDKPAQALEEFRAAIEADPEEPAAQYQIALTYRKLGQHEKSRQVLETFKNMKAKQQPWKAVFQLSKDTR